MNNNLGELKHKIALTYGIELDETTLSILNILMDSQKGYFNLQNQKLEEAINKINGTTKTLQISRDKPLLQAFWFGFGKFGAAFIFSLLVAFFFYSYWQYSENKKTLFPETLKYYKDFFDEIKKKAPKEVTDYEKQQPPPDK